MIVARPVRAVNLRGYSRPKARAKARHGAGNPAYLLTLGLMNSAKRSKKVAAKKHKKKSSAHRATNVSHAHSKSRKGKVTVSARTLMALAKGAKQHPRASNPMAKSIELHRPAQIVQAGVGVLVGVAATKAIVAALPTQVTQSAAYSTGAAAVVALGIWWLGSMVSPEFGAAAGLGGIAEAGSIALNGFLPDIGSKLALSGRGAGDFIPAKTNGFLATLGPSTDIATSLPKRQAMAVAAYPPAYKAA